MLLSYILASMIIYKILEFGSYGKICALDGQVGGSGIASG